MKNEPKRILIVGYGFIGQNFAKVFYQSKDYFKELGLSAEICGIANSKGYIYDENGLNFLDLEKSSNWIYENPLNLIEECKGNILVESTPTNVETGEPCISYIRRALENEMDVITSNKSIALDIKKLRKLAEEKKVKLKYGATVGGSIPVIAFAESLKVNKIKRIYGIFNGTTNYILSKMHSEKLDFDSALKEAQENGICEKNPSYDIEGIDTALKCVILANSVMEKDVKLENVKRTGISKITLEAIDLAKKNDCKIKLIGDIDKDVKVSPKLVPANHPVCVDGANNAITFETDLAGELTIIGKGAGKETVSTMLNDLLSILR